MNPQDQLADKIIAYMRTKGYEVATGLGEYNIVYLEGSDADGRANSDRPDGWNDRRLLIRTDPDGTVRMVLNAAATTEPGLAATLSAAARRRGGAARIAIGQHKGCWRMGHHKQRTTHPALVQVAALPVHRDYNRDSKRTGDRVDVGPFGINQHGTRAGILPRVVGTWSEGCLVGQVWQEHLNFIDLLRTDVRYQADNDFRFSATVIDGSDFQRWMDAASVA